MKGKLVTVLFFCVLVGAFYCYESDFYTLKSEYQNKTYREIPLFDKIGVSLIGCSSLCTGTPGCNIVFYNTISGKCEAFKEITDVNKLVYSDNTDVFEKTGGIAATTAEDTTVTTEASILTTSRCAFTTLECDKSGYIKIDATLINRPCFKVYTLNDRKSQSQAKSFCQSENSRLIVLRNKTVAQLMADYISCFYDNTAFSSYFWIGLEYSALETQWMWFDNSSHTSWSYNEGYTCGMMSKTGVMYAGDCLSSENFICESV